MNDIADIVDLDTYPLHLPESDRVAELLAAGRESLAQTALFRLPAFVREEAALEMASELLEMRNIACRYDKPRVAYDYGDQGFAPDHVREVLHPSRYYQVLNHQIRNDSPLRQVYYWECLTEFLRRILRFESFYRSECPHLSLSAKIAGEGDTDGWHYDSNDVVFSLLLQQPEGGGRFEYAPFIRSENDENYADVARLFDDPERHAQSPIMAPGDLVVFHGDLSMHRVTPVTGDRYRVIALFCYDEEPGMTFSQAYIEELYSFMPQRLPHLRESGCV